MDAAADMLDGNVKLTEKEYSYPHPIQVTNFNEMLKYDRDEDLVFLTKKRKTATLQTAKPKKRITFEERVEVVPIPMRNEYSNRIRSKIWSNASEIYQNAARNAVEFASEGYVSHQVYMLKDVFRR